jgi:phosphoribosyl-dephospho-CoA transferase
MFCRHNRVWLSKPGWERAFATVSATYAAELARWAEKGWPVIVRRGDPGTAAGTICLGLALPPKGGKREKIRIPFVVAETDIDRHELPLPLSGVVAELPLNWRDTCADLAGAATIMQLRLHVYGSVAMQATTGLPYLSTASDIDLLFYPETKPQLQEGLALLAAYACDLPLDGEIVFPSGRAVAWKEWAQAIANPARPRVMAKSLHAVHLVDATDLQAELRNRSWST